MSIKKICVSILALCMAASMAACQGSTASSQSSESAAAGAETPSGDSSAEEVAAEETAKITFVYMTLNNLPEADALKSVQDKVNEYTIPNLATEVELILFSRTDYQTQLNLMLAAGEQADLFRAESTPTINFIKDGSALDITDYLDGPLKETADTLYPDFLKLTTVDGRVYGINSMGSNYVPKGWTYRTDIIEELGIDLSGVKTFEDLTPIFAQVKEAYPNMILIDNVRADVIFDGYLGNVNHIDALSDGLVAPGAISGVVKAGGDNKVQNLYEMDEYKQVANLTREWYNQGYFAKDAATTTATTAELLMSGNCFSVFVGLGNPKIASQYSNNYGYNFDNIEVAPAWLQNGNKEAWMINSSCKNPENAARFLNLLYTNPEIDNLLVYGIEGRDYQFDEDNYVIPPEGFSDLNSVPYTCNMGYYLWGNKWITYLVKGGLDHETNKAAEENNYSAEKSPYYGFLFDYSEVEAEYTAVKNVIEEYKKAMWVGSLDVEPALEEMNKKLYASGLQTLMDAKQEQFDAWLSQQ